MPLNLKWQLRLPRWEIQRLWLRSTPEGRIGRTARWPASIGWIRGPEPRDRKSGVVCRIGDRSLGFYVMRRIYRLR